MDLIGHKPRRSPRLRRKTRRNYDASFKVREELALPVRARGVGAIGVSLPMPPHLMSQSAEKD